VPGLEMDALLQGSRAAASGAVSDRSFFAYFELAEACGAAALSVAPSHPGFPLIEPHSEKKAQVQAEKQADIQQDELARGNRNHEPVDGE